MRLFTLLLTLIILGLGGYFAGSAPFRQEWTDIYWISLTALGPVTAASTFFLGQTIGRFDKLIEFPLDSLQQEAFSSALKEKAQSSFDQMVDGPRLWDFGDSSRKRPENHEAFYHRRVGCGFYYRKLSMSASYSCRVYRALALARQVERTG